MASFRRPAATSLALVLLIGCEAVDFPISRDTSDDNLALAAAAAAPVTPPADLPGIGSAAYEGVLAANVSGDYDGSLYADLAVAVDFGAGTVTGEVTNVDLIGFFGMTDQNLDGTLAVVGTEAGGVIAANATGNLTGGTGNGVTGTAAADFDLDGNVRSADNPADTLYGTVTGGIAGDFGLTLSDGEFAATD